MSALITINHTNISLEVVESKIFTTSLQIAEVFEKQHKNIIQAISNLPDDSFKKDNFILSEYQDKQGKIRPCYKLSRDAFSLLVMGFTGAKAYKWKIDFINAFNLMEKQLKDIYNGKNINYIIGGYKAQIVQHNKRIEDLQNEVKLLTAKQTAKTSDEILALVNKGLKFDRLMSDYYKIAEEHSELKSLIARLDPLLYEILRVINTDKKQRTLFN